MTAQLIRSTLHALRSTLLPLCLLYSGCASAPERPEGANVEFRRPTVTGNMIKDVDVLVKSGHTPLLTLVDGQAVFGKLNPGTYTLTAVSRDPYQFSQFSEKMWYSEALQLVIEPGKNYVVEVAPAEAMSAGWVIRIVPTD